jgi:MFS family permease
MAAAPDVGLHTPDKSLPESPGRRSIVRRALVSIGLGTALSLMGDAALYAVLPTNTAAAGVSLASVGVLLSANRWIRLPLNGLAGIAYDRWPRRWLFSIAMFIGAISTALYAFTTGFWPLLAGRLLWGLAWSGIWVGGNTIVLDVSTAQDRGRLTGLYQLCFYLGATLGFPVGGLLTDWLGYHPALIAATVVTALGAVFSAFTLPETRGWQRVSATVVAEQQPSPAVGTPLARPAGDAGGPAAPPAAGVSTKMSLVAATLLYGANRFVVAGVLSATLALLVQERWGEVRLAAAQAPLGIATITGLLLGLSTLTSMFAAPMAGHWSDRIGNRWRVVSRMLLPGLLGTALLAVGQPMLIVFGVVLSALAAGSSQSLATTLLGDLARRERLGRTLGSMHTFGDLCSALAPPLAYAVLPFIGLTGVYAACVLLLAAVLVLSLRMAQRTRAN